MTEHYAKTAEDDIPIRTTATNHGPETARSTSRPPYGFAIPELEAIAAGRMRVGRDHPPLRSP
jgi:hypothetical protein